MISLRNVRIVDWVSRSNTGIVAIDCLSDFTSLLLNSTRNSSRHKAWLIS